MRTARAASSTCLRDSPGAAHYKAPSRLLPDRLLRPAKFCEFLRPQWRLGNREELIALRRCYRRCTEHRVCLSTMMHLVLEQMQQRPIGALRLHTDAAMHVNGSVRPIVI